MDRSLAFDKKLAENEDDLDALFDELNDEDERAFEEYRQKRLATLKAEYDRKRFGTVAEITKQNYVDEVNNAGEDIWVVVHVYKPGLVWMLWDFLIEISLKKKFLNFLIFGSRIDLEFALANDQLVTD